MTDMTAEQALDAMHDLIGDPDGIADSMDLMYKLKQVESFLADVVQSNSALTAPRVPEEAIRKNAPCELDINEQLAWAEGWNACRESMRNAAPAPADSAVESPSTQALRICNSRQASELARLRERVKVLEAQLEPDMFWEADDPECFRGHEIEDAIRDIMDQAVLDDGEWIDITLQRAVSLSNLRVRARYVSDYDIEYEEVGKEAARLRGGSDE